jgi:hypothetical protein
MASLYTQEADRKRLAQDAMAKVAPENETTTSMVTASEGRSTFERTLASAAEYRPCLLIK